MQAKRGQMKIYTKTGDQGETGLFAGPRVLKNHPRIEAFGSVDELNSMLGVIRVEPLPDDVDTLVGRIQNELFALGAELATPEPALQNHPIIEVEHIKALESEIDRLEAGLLPLKEFILPGGSRAAALLHLARAICRRSERRVVHLRHTDSHAISDNMVIYLNRLSDLLFVLARSINAASGVVDIAWKKPNR